jgi:hypothetical protein
MRIILKYIIDRITNEDVYWINLGQWRHFVHTVMNLKSRTFWKN